MRHLPQTVKAALLGVAALILTLKHILVGPLAGVVQPELDRIKPGLDQKTKPALERAHAVLDQAQAEITATIVNPQATTSVSNPNPRPSIPAPTAVVAPGSPFTSDDSPSHLRNPYSRALVRKILREAAVRHGVDPKLVLALSFWESGWDQSKVSETGAVGLMQVEPTTAQEAGPLLLGRPVDVSDPYDNADIGAAILREDIDAFRDPALALAAYYQGPTSVRASGLFPDTQNYVQGILMLASHENP